jgi:L-2,4-diaminobutyric acid acetyltransferase
MVAQIGTLERNTSYCYLLLAKMFGQTCAVAEQDGERVGFLAGFCPPERPEAIFVWQVGVSPEARGFGVATGLLLQVVKQTGATYLEATVGVSNANSRALFTGFARRLEAHCAVEPCFAASDFPEQHEEEQLFRIGPLDLTSEAYHHLSERYGSASTKEVTNS